MQITELEFIRVTGNRGGIGMKKNLSRAKRLAMIVLSLAVVTVFSMPTVFADGNGSMLLNFTAEGEQINDAEFDLYKVADLKEDGTVGDVADAFAPYADLIKGLKTPSKDDTSTSNDWREASVRLADFVTIQGIQPIDKVFTGRTGSGNGKAAFGHLSDARYLVVGKPLEKNGKVYTGAPFLADIQGEPRTANIKPNVVEKSDLSIKAVKIWSDNDDKAKKRPQTIQFQLYKNGEAYGDPKTLDENCKIDNNNNRWETTPWPNLERKDKAGKDITWTVKEVTTLPTGYRSSEPVETSETNDGIEVRCYTITNTYKEPDNPPGPGSKKMNVSVVKKWEDGENESGHPASVKVQLMVDGKEYPNSDPVTLSESNNWSYTWPSITVKNSEDPQKKFTVVEVTSLDSYSAFADEPVVEGNRVSITLNNSYIPDIPDDPTPLGPPGVDYTVQKVWEDKGYETKRPTSVDVILTKDGKEYDTQTLNEANGWKYTWTDLDGEATWSVKEKSIPAGYEVKTSLENYTVTMTNTYNPENKTTPPSGTTKKTGKLPQTGMLWWPVPVLGCAGLLLILLGLVRKNKRRRTDGE